MKRRKKICCFISNEISPGKFEEMLKTMMEIDYNHHEIAETIEPLVEFTESIASLLERLDNLNQ